MDTPIRVLHVEDDAQFADLAATYLERIDDRFSVETATDVTEGLEHLADGEFDCVVSDYDMPGQNGIEFLENVRTERPNLPFILFTGKGSEAVASEAISKGVTDYLKKKSGADRYELLANRIRNAVRRRRAERRAELWTDAIEAANEGIAIVGPDGRYAEMNRAYADLYGVEPAELIGEPWVKTVPEDEAERLREDVFPTLEAESWSSESVGKRVDDSVYPKLLSLADLGDGGRVCVIRDISDQKEREAELRAKAAKLDVLFEQSPDLIDIHDADGELIDANRRLCDALGYTESELIGKRVWEVDEAIDPETARELWAEMAPGEMRTLRGRYRRRDGSTFPVEVHLVRVDLDGDARFFVIAREVDAEQ
ncbi:PAS domain-containing response regulator [Halorussus marinus]|uniref:PAS domain-containing response regulator n=1 Tax=Halorussus marinus TaxID=2505976 RepID=UPI001091CAFF|nr:PAS domain S-box protein [Halorussus marinus]